MPDYVPADLVMQTSPTTGLAAFALAGTVQGFQTFAAAHAIGTVIPCRVKGIGGEWETGRYTLMDTPLRLERTAVVSSSNGNQPVPFSAGTKEIYETVLAADLPKMIRTDAGAVGSVAGTDFLVAVIAGVAKRIAIDDLIMAVGVAPGDLTAAGTLAGADIVTVTQGGVEKRTTLTAIAAAVAAINAGGEPEQSFTVPGAPGVGVIVAGVGYVDVPFTAPASDGGTAIIDYTATLSTGQTGTSATSPIRITAPAGTAVTATVKARNSVGSSAASAVSNSVTPTAGATAPGAPTIGVAVAGDGYIDVAFTAPASNGGSAILDYTATLSTGQTVTGASSPLRVTAPNGTAATATVKARNAVGLSAASAASNSVTPAAAGGTTYTVAGYSGNTIKPTVDATTPTATHGSLKQMGPTKFGTNASYPDYFTITPEVTSAVCGWGTSATVPPAEITAGQNASTGTSINGMTTMAHAAGNTTYRSTNSLWVGVGSGTSTWYPWIKPLNGVAVCIAPDGCVVTGA